MRILKLFNTHALVHGANGVSKMREDCRCNHSPFATDANYVRLCVTLLLGLVRRDVEVMFKLGCGVAIAQIDAVLQVRPEERMNTGGSCDEHAKCVYRLDEPARVFVREDFRASSADAQFRPHRVTVVVNVSHTGQMLQHVQVECRRRFVAQDAHGVQHPHELVALIVDTVCDEHAVVSVTRFELLDQCGIVDRVEVFQFVVCIEDADLERAAPGVHPPGVDVEVRDLPEATDVHGQHFAIDHLGRLNVQDRSLSAFADDGQDVQVGADGLRVRLQRKPGALRQKKIRLRRPLREVDHQSSVLFRVHDGQRFEDRVCFLGSLEAGGGERYIVREPEHHDRFAFDELSAEFFDRMHFYFHSGCPLSWKW